MSKFKDDVPNLNHVYLSKWLIYYYEAWTKSKSKSILREFDSFKKVNIHLMIQQLINLKITEHFRILVMGYSISKRTWIYCSTNFWNMC